MAEEGVVVSDRSSTWSFDIHDVSILHHGALFKQRSREVTDQFHRRRWRRWRWRRRVSNLFLLNPSSFILTCNKVEEEVVKMDMMEAIIGVEGKFQLTLSEKYFVLTPI